MNSLTSFQFEQKSVRTITHKDGTPWFVLTDVLSAMGTSTTTSQAILQVEQGLGKGYVVSTPIPDTRGIAQQTTVVAEAAATFLVARSNTRKGRKLNRWFHTEALPQIKDLTKYVINAINEFEVPDDLPDMYVYAIRERGTGNVKVGISRDPEQRLRQLQTGNSQELELVAYRKAENRFSDERAIHADAEAYRIRGEWFSASALQALQ